VRISSVSDVFCQSVDLNQANISAMYNSKATSASVRFRTLDAGVVEVVYSGLISDESYSRLIHEVIDVLMDAPSAVLRYDRALVAMKFDLDVPHNVWKTPPAAVVVLPDQMDFWRSYARKLASTGLMRCVFLASEEALAVRWARQVALHSAGNAS